MKKIIIIAIIVIGLGVGAYFIFFSGTTEDYTFRYDKVSKGDITVVVTATGTLSAVNTVQVGSQVSGTISKLYADFNSIVKAGQVIAQIDSTLLIQSVRDAEANLDRVIAQYNEAKRNLDRTQSLFDKQLESQQSYDAALTNFESGKSALKQSQAQLERVKLNLSYATIYAPINGVVIDRKVDIGQTVNAGFSAPTLFTIANDLSRMQVQATIDEGDIGKISVGQESTFTVDAYPDEKFSGTISQIRLSPVIVQNVVNYTVIIDVPNQDLKLMPGMTANVKVLVAKKNNVLKIPNIALRFQPPTELTDSVKIREMREAFRSNAMISMDRQSRDSSQAKTDRKSPSQQSQIQGKAIADNIKNAKPEQNRQGIRDGMNQGQDQGNKSFGRRPDVSTGMMGNREGGKTGMMQFSQEDRERFKKIRDSIQSAHGGNLSREEMMQEMQKVFMRSRQKNTFTQSQKPSNTEAASRNKFEINSKFPQYEKSVTTPLNQVGMGRVWVMNSQGKLEPVFVRTGLNDGQSTEVITDNLKEGQQIVIGAFSNTAQAAPQTQNPFTGQQRMQGPGMGGGRR